jgi:hypothetical protein
MADITNITNEKPLHRSGSSIDQKDPEIGQKVQPATGE